MNWYEKISKTLGYSREKDQYATDLLSSMIKDKALSYEALRDLIYQKNVIIFGAGPSLEEDLIKIDSLKLLDKCLSIVADTAISAFIEIKKIPHIIVSDLDGKIQDLLEANKKYSIMVIHAHGDNLEALKTHVPKLKKIFGTTQVEPRDKVYNFGGFTDGDRAFFLALEFDAKSIALAGMDLGREIGKYSKLKPSLDFDVKVIKLRFAKELLEWGSTLKKVKLFNLTSKGVSLKGFERISYEDYLNYLR
ncbi:MAG: 6-hydroxymethylpterin diphosphokinase MptE-like protein [Nitrososphaerales archaeon]